MSDIKIKVVRVMEIVVERNQYPGEWTDEKILHAERLTYEENPERWLNKNSDNLSEDEIFFSIERD